MGNESASLAHDNFPLHKSSTSTIVLVGFMGAGKTSVGKELAALLGCAFEDLDDRIKLRAGRSIEEIFRDSGELEFRRCEHEALREVLTGAVTGLKVLALGGGAFVQTANVPLLQQKNIHSVFLDAPVNELFRRCQQQSLNRPLRKDESSFQELHELRRPLYLHAMHHVETGGKSVYQVAQEIAKVVEITPFK